MNICFFTENYYKGGLDTFIINLLNEWPLRYERLLSQIIVLDEISYYLRKV